MTLEHALKNFNFLPNETHLVKKLKNKMEMLKRQATPGEWKYIGPVYEKSYTTIMNSL